MIAHLNGKIILQKKGFVILDVAGVGYKIQTKTSEEYKEGVEKNFFIHHHIREDMEDLYGFSNYDELELFEALISVNGVGPKVAMLVLSSADAGKITAAILNEDLSFFQSISGIGKKVAAKIILDLKGKIAGIESGGIISKISGGNQIVEALEPLGYKASEIIKLIPQIPINLSKEEDKIKWLIKNIHH